MASENARAVAKEVSENLRKGKRVILGKIIKKKGYADSTSKRPKIITETKSYQEAIKPVVDRLIIERDRAIKAMKGKISKAKYRDLVDSADKLTKNIQLLSGGATERNITIEISQEIADKNVFNASAKNNSSMSK